MDVNFALEDYEVARGFILACQSYPVTDKVVVDFRRDRHRLSSAYGQAPSAGKMAETRVRSNPRSPYVPHPFSSAIARCSIARVQAIHERSYWSAFPESASPKVYGEGAAEAGKAAFDRLLGQPLSADAAGHGRRRRRRALAVRHSARHHLSQGRHRRPVRRGRARARPMEKADPETWAGVCLEILARINKASFEIRQRGDAYDRPGVHDGVPGGRPARAGSRARSGRVRVGRAVARAAPRRSGKSRRGRTSRIRMEKRFRVVPRGIGLVIGCCTFPTWNGYPGLFASLATGNAVVVKPHPGGDPAARDHREDRARGAGRSGLRSERRDAVRARGRRRRCAKARAAPRGAHHRLHRQHRQRPLARGACAAGAGLHRKSRREPDHRRLRRRHEGGRAQRRVLAVALHGPDVHGAAEHLRAARRHRHRRRAACRSTRWRKRSPTACASSSADPARAVEVLGAVQNDGVLRRLEAARSLGNVVLDTQTIAHPAFPDATVRTPLIVKLARPTARRISTNGSAPSRS